MVLWSVKSFNSPTVNNNFGVNWISAKDFWAGRWDFSVGVLRKICHKNFTHCPFSWVQFIDQMNTFMEFNVGLFTSGSMITLLIGLFHCVWAEILKTVNTFVESFKTWERDLPIFWPILLYWSRILYWHRLYQKPKFMTGFMCFILFANRFLNKVSTE